MPLATNSERFKPLPTDVTYESDYAFTGNHWGANRELINQLSVRPAEKFVIFREGLGRRPAGSALLARTCRIRRPSQGLFLGQDRPRRHRRPDPFPTAR